MKKKLLIIILILSCCCVSKNAKAQYVTIPDANFVAYLNSNFPSCMNGNQLDTICSASWWYNDMNCNNYGIQNLEGVQYFKSLNNLFCDGNLLAYGIPELPPNLQIINCEFCIWLSSLPALPSTLQYLNCNGTSLVFLPSLPTGLLELSCRSNHLNALPSLPSSLKYLNCSYNLLTALPALPVGLDSLICTHNQLAFLPLIPNGLSSLDFGFNNLINFPILPQSCKKVSAYNNLLTSISSLPDTLIDLNLQNNPNLNCLPELKKITNLNFTGTNISCIPNLGNVTNSNPPLNSLPFCGPLNQNGCDFFWNMSGSVFNDSVANCTVDIGEKKFENIKINLLKNGSLVQQTYTNAFGEFIFKTDTGNYTCAIDTSNLSLAVTCPANGFYNAVITTNTIDTSLNFGLQCAQGFDVGVKAIVNDSGVFRLGHTASVTFKMGDMSSQFGLHCASGISGAITIIATGGFGNITAAAGALIPVINGDTLFYAINDFGNIDFNNDFRILVHIPILVSGNAVCFSVQVSPTTNDLLPLNNNLQHCFYHVNSFDPNLKEAYPKDKIISTMNDITYIIRFQNTGNAPAENIFITDTLDSNLDAGSFEMLAFSHQPIVSLVGNVLKFKFPDINLPDSTNNEPNSHGFFQFKIKLKDSLALGTVLKNNADIFFDYNTPVKTNTVLDTIVDCGQTVEVISNDTSLCAGEVFTAIPTSSFYYTYSWYVDSFFMSSNQNIAIPNLSTGNHEIKLVASNAYCNTEVFSNVVIHSLPLVDLGNDSVTCNLPVILNSGVNNASYLWSNGKSTKKITVKNTGTFSVIVTDVNGCSNTDTINVTVHALPSINIGIDTSTCSVPVPLDAGSGNVSYQWSNGATTQTIIANVSANYSVVVVDSNGCSNADTINVVINPLPAKPVISQSISLLTSSSNAGNQWLLNDSIINGATNNSYTVTLTGWYAVQVTDSNGCSNKSDSIYMDLTGANDVSNAMSELSIVPNPATTSFEILGKKFQVNDIVTINDVIGKVVYQTKISQPTSSFKVETIDYPNGIYCVNIKTTNGIYTLKLVKQ